MTRSQRIISFTVLFAPPALLLLSIAPVRLSTEPAVELYRVVSVEPEEPARESAAHSPDEPDALPASPVTRAGESDQVRVSRISPPIDGPFASMSARTDKTVAFLTHDSVYSANIPESSLFDVSQAGVAVAVGGVVHAISTGHSDTATDLRASRSPLVSSRPGSAAVVRSSGLFLIDRDGAGFEHHPFSAGTDETSVPRGTRFAKRLVGPMSALEVVEDLIVASDAHGYMYAFDLDGHLIDIRRPSQDEPLATVFSVSARPGAILAVVEGVGEPRLTLVDLSAENGFETRSTAVLDDTLRRPRHIEWTGDSVVVETDEGIAKYDVAGELTASRPAAGRIVGLRYQYETDLLAVLTEQPGRRSRLALLNPNDLSAVVELSFAESVFSLSAQGVFLGIGLATEVVLYRVTVP